ncbi:TetR family transcriptional regulator [Mycolicibacterium aichiense]|uniref:TetR family transcriptional regulator n=1 Tax=Mycolicibacterium aichiense TaxID=1799 RepID=UPI003D66DBA2
MATKGERTRERLLGAAIGEFRRVGTAHADVKAIAAAAGVAQPTFYSYFPTKHHVLIELERREEERIAAELARFFADGPELPVALAKIVATIADLEPRLGGPLFKDFLALHFSSARPPEEIWTNHPVIVAVVEELRQAQRRSAIPADVDPLYNGLFFLVGLYALLLTLPVDGPTRATVLERYVVTSLHGMQVGPLTTAR